MDLGNAKLRDLKKQAPDIAELRDQPISGENSFEHVDSIGNDNAAISQSKYFNCDRKFELLRQNMLSLLYKLPDTD